MSDVEVKGAAGEMDLLTQQDPENQRLVRSVSLSTSADGKSALPIEIDAPRSGASVNTATRLRRAS
jgi:hypothetical protein